MSASTAIANTEDLQATVYQTNHIGTSFSYSFGPADGLLPGQTYTVSLQHLKFRFKSLSRGNPQPEAIGHTTPQRVLHSRSLQRSDRDVFVFV